MSDIDKILLRTLRQRVDDVGLREFSRRIEIEPSTISRLLNRRQQLSGDNYRRLTKALGLKLVAK